MDHFDVQKTYLDKFNPQLTNTLAYASTPEYDPGLAAWDLGVKKRGDVGMDLPVKIKGMDKIISPSGKPYLQVHPEPPIHNYLINYQEGYIDVPSLGYAEVPTAIHLKIPDDAWGMIRPRSSTGWKRRLVVFEATIDSGFTGQICCLVFNPGAQPVRLKHDDAVAQFILVPKYRLEAIVQIPYKELPHTDRNTSGFGSTGR